MNNEDIKWGPTGEVVYERTYSRKKPNGEQETWPETVERVARGNLELVYGPQGGWSRDVSDEYADLVAHMLDFRIIPAGRHLWASGVKGRQYLMNCWTAGWTEKLSDHFEFTFMRLMEGGGVGANYSMKHIGKHRPKRLLRVHIVCDPEHPDYELMREQGILSEQYDSDWDGAFEVEDSREGWAEALVDLIDTYFLDDVKHENRVYDVTNVRARGARLKTFGGVASGPAPFGVMMKKISGILNDSTFYGDGIDGIHCMEIDHAIAECVVSGGNRRSARMAMMHWRDPFIRDFIECKQETGEHWTTNISVEVDDEFFAAIAGGIGAPDFEHASEVMMLTTRAVLKNGEPGFWNSSKSNEGELEPVYCTNPCGEITLHPWEACCLGHVNLDAFATGHGEYVDMQALATAHELMTRFLIRATYADINDPKSLYVQQRNRRIGVGHLGVQGFLAKQGISISDVAEYGSSGHSFMRWILTQMRHHVDKVAEQYAFDLRIPVPVKTTTVAPTGSVAKLPGVTEGIHPIYARFFERRVRFAVNDEAQADTVLKAAQQGYEIETCQYDASGNTKIVVYPTKDPLVEQVEALGFDASLVQTADEIGLERMLAWQEFYQRYYANNAVSFTINFPEGSIREHELRKALLKYLPDLKGTTLMPDATRPQAPYTRITEEQYEAAVAKTIEDSIDLECGMGGACPIR